MEINTETVGKYMMLSWSGDLTGHESGELVKYFQNLTDEKSLFLAIDFEKVSEIDSAGIGAFAFAIRNLQESQGSMVFIGMNKSVEDVFNTTGVLEYVATFPNVDSFRTSLK